MSKDKVTDLSPVICKDCLPVFYHSDEIPPQPAGTLVLKHVALCPRHAATAELLEAVKVAADLCQGLLPGLSGLKAAVVDGIRKDCLALIVKAEATS